VYLYAHHFHKATFSAVRYNPPTRRFYRRLLGQGKHKKVALTACMRKLIVMLDAMVGSWVRTMFNEDDQGN
jgi:hypothetical protein